MKKITLLALATVVATSAFASSYDAKVKYLMGDGRVTGNNKISLAGNLAYDATDTLVVTPSASVDMFSSKYGLWGFGNCAATEGLKYDADKGVTGNTDLSDDCSTSATSYQVGLDIKFSNDMMTLQTNPVYKGGDYTDNFAITRGNTKQAQRSAWALMNYGSYNVNENVMVAAIADFYSVEDISPDAKNPADSKDDYTLSPARYGAYGLMLVDETNYNMVLGGYGGYTTDVMDLKAGLLFMQDPNAAAENVIIAKADTETVDPSVEHAEDSLINIFGRGEYKVMESVSVYSGLGVGIPQSKITGYSELFGPELYVELGAKGTF